jgi:hypothetical protein
VKLEKEIQRELLKRCKLHKSIAWIDRANSGKVRVKGGFMQLHEKGTPDLIGFTVSGQFIGIELKRPSTKKAVNEDQVIMGERLIKAGCVYGVAYDLDSLNAILDNIE